jgi:DNA-binding transcriptional LysR family regulator
LLAAGVRPRPQDLPRFGWATVQLRESASQRTQALFGMPADAPLPVALSCDNQGLLREAVLSSDLLLFTWRSWLQADLAQGLIVDLGERLQPALPRKATQIECAIVQMRGRTASPAAKRLIGLITKGAARARA